MAFLETPRFPLTMTYGTSSGPTFKTDVVVYSNGREYRNSYQTSPINQYDLKYSVRKRSDLMEVYKFFLARKGRFEGFRIKDCLDYTTALNGSDAPSDTDQQIGTGDGVTTDFQLIKDYTITGSSATTTKNIVKPVSGTVVASLNSINTTAFTVDTTSGIISFNVAPANGVIIRAGCEFDIPVRFDTDELTGIELVLINNSNNSVDRMQLPSIPVKEILF